MKRARWLVRLGSLVLVATAAFHGTGYTEVTDAVAESNLEGMITGAIGGLWLYPSVHWLFLAFLAVVTLRFRSPGARRWVLALIAGLLVVDITILLIHVGPFVGEAMLGVAALAYAGGAWLARGCS